MHRLLATSAPAGRTWVTTGGASNSREIAEMVGDEKSGRCLTAHVAHRCRVITAPAHSSVAGRVSANGSKLRARASS